MIKLIRFFVCLQIFVYKSFKAFMRLNIEGKCTNKNNWCLINVELQAANVWVPAVYSALGACPCPPGAHSCNAAAPQGLGHQRMKTDPPGGRGSEAFLKWLLS